MLSGKDEITEVQARRWSFRNILKQRGLEKGLVFREKACWTAQKNQIFLT